MLLLNARGWQDARLREARQQTADILGTVKDGLFLLDADMVIGTAYSSAMESPVSAKGHGGARFRAVAENIVSEKTLATGP